MPPQKCVRVARGNKPSKALDDGRQIQNRRLDRNSTLEYPGLVLDPGESYETLAEDFDVQRNNAFVSWCDANDYECTGEQGKDRLGDIDGKSQLDGQ
jgi:hypothetical protein